MAEVVEKRLPHGFVTKDLFGCIDILGVRPGGAVLGVQTTTRANQSARYKKAVALPSLRTWLEAGCVFRVHGWAKVGDKGKRKTWQVSSRDVTLEDLGEAQAEPNGEKDVATARPPAN